MGREEQKRPKLLNTLKVLTDITAHNSALADTFEAFLTALFLDKGLFCVENFLEIVLFPKIETVSSFLFFSLLFSPVL